MAKKLNTMIVTGTEWITAHMVRIRLGGPGFAEFSASADTDSYIKIIFERPGVVYPEPFDLERVRSEFAPEDQPAIRTYTIRRVDAERGEIWVDFVVHGSEGVAGPWAASAEVGDVVHFSGPGSGYRPDPTAPWHLMASDEAGLPALSAALEALPDSATVKVFVEVAGPDDEIALVAPSGAEITWVHRGAGSDEATDAAAGDNAPIIAAVRSAEWLDGEPQVFIHGEAQAVMHNLRRYVRKERGVSAKNASISGYWRRGRTEDGFRQWKAELKKEEERAGSAL